MRSTQLFMHIVGLAISVVCVILLVKLSDAERELSVLSGRQNSICRGKLREIKNLMEDRIVPDLRLRIAFRLADDDTFRVCMPDERPPSSSKSDQCFVMKQEEDCYRGLLQQLELMYQKHSKNWE